MKICILLEIDEVNEGRAAQFEKGIQQIKSRPYGINFTGSQFQRAFNGIVISEIDASEFPNIVIKSK